MRKIYLHAALMLIIVSTSCSNTAQNPTELNSVATANQEVSLSDHENMSKAVSSDSNEESENISNNTLAQTKKIVKTGSISIDTKDIRNTKEKLDLTIKNIGGYYEQENTSAGSTYTNYNLTVRIPTNQFDNFIKNIENGEDKITEKSIQAQDISIQYYDTESRIKTKRAYLEKYNQMVKSAKNINELLQIQEQIRQLQEDIESSESLLRNLSGQVNYSVVTINIFNSSASSSAYSDSFISQIADSFKTGWEMISVIFLSFISIWPIILIIVLSVFGWRKYKSRK